MNPPPNDSALLSLHQIGTMLLARRRVVFGTLVATVLVTAGLTSLLHRTWTSSADVYVDYRENDPIGGRNFSALLDDSYMQTQIDMIRSQAVAQKVVEKLGLAQSPDFRKAAEGAGEARAHEALIASVIRSTDVANKRGSRVLEVAYTAGDPTQARDAAAALVDSYIALSQQLAGRAARSRSEQYSAQLEQLRGEADAIQENITRFQRETGVLKSSDDDIDTRKLNQMELDLAQLQIRRQEAVARGGNSTQLVRSGIRADDLPEIGQFGPVQDLRAKLNDVERRLSEVGDVLGDRHPTVTGLLAERQELRARLDRTARAALDSQRSEATRLTLQETALTRDLEAQRQKVLQRMQSRDRLLSYERQLASVQQIYNAALQKYDGLLMASNITLPSLSVLRQAEIPSVPSGPKWRRNLAAGFGVGAVAGLFLALALELARRRVRSREDMARGLGLPLLGEIGRRSAEARA